MSRYIDADKLISSLAHYKQGKWGEYETLSVFELESAIENFADTNEAEVAEIKRGRWIKNDGRYGWHCSVCGEDDLYAFAWNSDTGENELQDHYCPNCGAKMDDVGDE